ASTSLFGITWNNSPESPIQSSLRRSSKDSRVWLTATREAGSSIARSFTSGDERLGVLRYKYPDLRRRRLLTSQAVSVDPTDRGLPATRTYGDFAPGDAGVFCRIHQ